MEYGQFVKILEGENLSRKVTVEQLKEIVQQYPYFQTAHILLAKTLQEQNNIDFDRALKLAAVYAGDRNLLFDYINKKEASTASSIKEPVKQPLVEAEKEVTPKEVIETKSDEPEISTPSFVKKEEPYSEYFSEEEILGIEHDEEKEEKIYDPHDLIRKRLAEIMALPASLEKEHEPERQAEEDVVEETIPVKAELEKKEEIKPEPVESKAKLPVQPSKQDIESIITNEVEKAKDDPLSRMEVEYAMEAGILESLEKLSPLPQKEKEIAEASPKVEKAEVKENNTTKDEPSPRSFTEWLRTISPKPFHNYTEVHSVPDVEHIKVDEPLVSEEGVIEISSTEEELIDKFIATEPKIVPSKTEFYSPINQAKKSLIEHDDVVSETLAKIYRDQGNLGRARWCYERLMLLHPEKSSFFAALLKEIDEINKEDL